MNKSYEILNQFSKEELIKMIIESEKEEQKRVNKLNALNEEMHLMLMDASRKLLYYEQLEKVKRIR